MGILDKVFGSSDAGIGAIAGGLLGGPLGAGIGLGIGGTKAAGEEAAKAAGEKAAAEQKIAQEALEFQKATRAEAQEAAEPSFEELQAIQNLAIQRDQILGRQEQAIQREEELLAAVDPAIIEAGQQALQLLQGQEAQALSPIRDNRQKQRQELENQLAQRLGPGFRTSSAGIEALNRFDDATSNLLFNAQQSTLNQFLNVAAASRPDLVRDVATAGATFGQLAGQEIAANQNIAGRKVSAITQTPVSFQNVLQTAGAGSVEAILRAENKGQFFGTIGNLAGQIGFAGLGAAAGAVGGPGAAAGATGGGGQVIPTGQQSLVGGGQTFGDVSGGLPRTQPNFLGAGR